MKRGGPGHPKCLHLAQLLNLRKYEAVGLMECVWHWAGQYAADGGIGRWSDEAIADGVSWPLERASELVDAFVTAELFDRSETCRLYVHDWHEHADDAVHMRIARSHKRFADGSRPRLTRLTRMEREECESFYSAEDQALAKNNGRSKYVRTKAHKCAPTGAYMRTADALADSLSLSLSPADALADTLADTDVCVHTERQTDSVNEFHAKTGESASVKTTTSNKTRAGTPAVGSVGEIARSVAASVEVGVAGIEQRKATMIQDLANRAARVTGEEHYRDWYAAVATTLWPTDGGFAELEDGVKYCELCADKTQRRMKDVGELKNPAGWLFQRATDICTKRGIRWPPAPKRGAA